MAVLAFGDGDYDYSQKAFAEKIKELKKINNESAESVLAKLFEITEVANSEDATKRFLRLGFTDPSGLVSFAFITWHEMPGANVNGAEMWIFEAQGKPKKQENLKLPSNEAYSFTEVICAMRDERLNSTKTQEIILRLNKLGWGKKELGIKPLDQLNRSVSILDGNINGDHYACIAPMDGNPLGVFIHQMVIGFFKSIQH